MSIQSVTAQFNTPVSCTLLRGLLGICIPSLLRHHECLQHYFCEAREVCVCLQHWGLGEWRQNWEVGLEVRSNSWDVAGLLLWEGDDIYPSPWLSQPGGRMALTSHGVGWPLFLLFNAHVHVWCVSICMWKPEVALWCPPQQFSTLSTEIGPLSWSQCSLIWLV